MSHRYAVLWEVGRDGRTRPVGLAVQQDGSVIVETPDDLCIPRRYEEPFTLTGPDFASVRYTPADEQYFDQVLLDLSRAFIIGKQGVVADATDSGVVLGLLVEHVLRPLRVEYPTAYAMGGRYPAVKAHNGYHRESAYAAAPSEEPEATCAPESSLVAV